LTALRLQGEKGKQGVIGLGADPMSLKLEPARFLAGPDAAMNPVQMLRQLTGEGEEPAEDDEKEPGPIHVCARLTVSAVGLQPGRVEYKVSLTVRYALAAK
jgi:hypothetical protein